MYNFIIINLNFNLMHSYSTLLSSFEYTFKHRHIFSKYFNYLLVLYIKYINIYPIIFRNSSMKIQAIVLYIYTKYVLVQPTSVHNFTGIILNSKRNRLYDENVDILILLAKHK